ncbi:hypothetical protein BT96DRAFT_935755 [Gymnopus androsaceus JB14]|uniref:DUF6534 domain-containing protein n=1 Tax=Gymnopus androsaceus JB14 TaxID=1447944 RepID=A0A6A4I363_9AGAR|nr:hypothetical protein BT96DRAFT_935755 [Gymnopus androsaceus JB14]
MTTLIPLDSTLGVALIGIILSTLLFGITCFQVYMYYTQYCSHDHLVLKLLVAGLFTLDAFHVVLLVLFYYHYTVTNFGDYTSLLHITWSGIIQALLAHVISTIIQFLEYYLGYNILGTYACILFTAFTILWAVTTFQLDLFTSVESNDLWSITALSTNAACDMLIASSMIFYLAKKRTAFARTNMVITRLITYALNTCLLTTICGTACVIAYVTDGNSTFVEGLFLLILARLYVCCFVSTLNSRETMRQDLSKGSGSNCFITLSHIGGDASA